MFNKNTMKLLLNNKYLSYVLVSLLIVIIILFKYLNESTKLMLKKCIRNPNIMIILLMGICVLSVYNLPMAILLSLTVLIILSYTPTNIETFKNKEDKKERPHFLMKHFNIDLTKMTNDLQKGLEENRKQEINNNVKLLKKGEKEQKKSVNKDNIAIKKRNFDLQNDDDTNLLNTRAICNDIIKRINFEYEDRTYLKKYISSRIEEIVDLNNLLEDNN